MSKTEKLSDEKLLAEKALVRKRVATVAQASFGDGAISQSISHQLIKILPRRALVAAFMALTDEPSLHLAQIEADLNLRLAFPKLVGNGLEFFICKTTAEFVKNKLGVLEPHPLHSERIEISDLFAVIVPGLAFDRKGMRLGRGKGYYDRALTHFAGLKIGVCSSAQILNEDLPCGDFDVAMDIVVSEKFILKRFDS